LGFAGSATAPSLARGRHRQTLTLGDTTLTMYLTPGHTPGTISTIIPVKDNGRSHVMAEWGGTAFNFTITPDKDREYWFNTYIASAERFRDIAAKAGADGVIANHTNFDGSKVKLPKLAARKPGDPHPYVIGADSVRRYPTVADRRCAKAAPDRAGKPAVGRWGQARGRQRRREAPYRKGLGSFEPSSAAYV
jgi:metallo-beta-lactamase class B